MFDKEVMRDEDSVPEEKQTESVDAKLIDSMFPKILMNLKSHIDETLKCSNKTNSKR
jgi:hypothetical protein